MFELLRRISNAFLSPRLTVLFFVIPLAAYLKDSYSSYNLLLINNLAFLVHLSAMLAMYIAGIVKGKSERGNIGGMIFYAGLILVLIIGTYDYFMWYRNVIYHGEGNPIGLKIDRPHKSFGDRVLSKRGNETYQLQIKKQYLPYPEAWPMGASDIIVYDNKGKKLKRDVIAPGNPPMKVNGFEFSMKRLVYDVMISLFRGKGELLFTGWVRLEPIKDKTGEYKYYGQRKEQGIIIDAWFNPEGGRLKSVADVDGKRVEAILAGGNEYSVAAEDYLTRMPGYIFNSEIHIKRTKHRALLYSGLFISIVGAIIWALRKPDGRNKCI